MEILKANQGDLSTIDYIVKSTINEVYPNYYSAGVVKFFLKIHSRELIERDIKLSTSYLIVSQGKSIGTFLIKNNEFSRFFVLPKYMGKGFGSQALDFIENVIFCSYDEIKMCASKSGLPFYINRGYEVAEYREECLADGEIEGYHIMSKSKKM